MSSIQPTGPRNLDALDTDATATPAAGAADTAAASGVRATRIPTPIRPPIGVPGPSASWGGPASLGTDLERSLDGGDFADVKDVLRNALRIANSRSLERGPMIKAVNDAIESLSRQGKLDGLILSLNMTPDLMHGQPVQTLVRGFLDANGTEAAKRAWNEDSLAATRPNAQNLTRDVTEGTNLGVDELVSMHARRLVDMFNQPGVPSADAKKTLDQTIAALSRKGVLDDALMAMGREADEFIRTHPHVRYYPLHRQFHDMVEAHGSAESKRMLAEAERLAAADALPAGSEIGGRIGGAIGQSSDREVRQLAHEWLRAPSDSPKRVAIMNDAVVKLSRDGKLDDFIRSVRREDQEALSALFRKHPGIRPMLVFTDRLIGDAIDQSGTPEAKAAWARAMRASGSPSGYERAADLAGALRGGEDKEVANGCDQLLDVVNVHPPTRPRTEDLNSAVLSLSRDGQLDDFAKALRRIDQKSARDAGPNVRIASRLSMFGAAVERFGTPANKRAWAAAVRP